MLISQRVPAIGLWAAALLGGCDAASGPNAPPLEIRGRYTVGWTIIYAAPDAGALELGPFPAVG